MDIHQMIEEQTELLAALKAEAVQLGTAKEINRGLCNLTRAYAIQVKYKELKGCQLDIQYLEDQT